MSRSEQIARIDKAIALCPGRAHYRETRAIFLIDLRRFREAQTDLEEAITLAPRPYLHHLRGLVLCQRGEFAASLADFDAAISGQPENAQFYKGRSLARSRLGHGSSALADAERLVRLAPQMAESHYAYGMALMTLGRYGEAEEAFSLAIVQRPELTYPLIARATLRERRGDVPGAASDRDEASRQQRRRNACAVCIDPFRY